MYVNMQSECIIFLMKLECLGGVPFHMKMLPEKELSKTLLLFLQMK